MAKIFIVVLMLQGEIIPVASFEVSDIETCEGYVESINDELSFVEYQHNMKAECLER